LHGNLIDIHKYFQVEVRALVNTVLDKSVSLCQLIQIQEQNTRGCDGTSCAFNTCIYTHAKSVNSTNAKNTPLHSQQATNHSDCLRKYEADGWCRFLV